MPLIKLRYCRCICTNSVDFSEYKHTGRLSKRPKLKFIVIITLGNNKIGFGIGNFE